MAVLMTVFCVIISTFTRAARLSKTMVSGRTFIKLQPSIVVTYFTLFASFAGHADASMWNYTGKCLQEAFGSDPNCVVNDATISVTEISAPNTCVKGGQFLVPFVNLTIQVGSQKRYDIGMYVGLNATSNALTGSECYVTSLDNSTAQTNVEDLDQDACLDYEQVSDPKTAYIQATNISISCQPSTNGNATISACFVYDINKKTDCKSRTCYGEQDEVCLLPGTTSVSFASRVLWKNSVCFIFA